MSHQFQGPGRTLLTLLMIIYACGAVAQPIIKIDSTFNSIGYHTKNLNPAAYNVQAGHRIIVNQPDKKYLVRGFVNPLGAYLKYNRDGSLDTNFNKTGVLVQPGSERYVENFTVDALGRMINMVSKPAVKNEVGFMRTRPSGIPDSSFGTNGILYVPNTNDADGYFFPMPDGRFILASNFRYNDTVGIKLQQFKSNYTLDSSFGANGVVTHKINSFDLYIRNVDVFADGRILVAGTTRSSPPYTPYDYDAFILGCLPNGALDLSFGNMGFLSPYAKNTLDDHYYGCYILPDQKFLGYGFESGMGFIARYHSNGAIDSSFGFLGRVFISAMQVYTLQRQRDGKLLGTGFPGYTIARITEDGARDTNFGTNGVYQSPGFAWGFPYASALEDDTTYLITGNAFESNQSNNITTARYAIRFQPMVTGVRSRYCVGDNGSGTIINLPRPASDTIVSVTLDTTTVLQVNAQGQFNFSAGAARKHLILVKFATATNTWTEIIQFTTGTSQPVVITTQPQLLCEDGSNFTIRTSTASYWYGHGISVQAPVTAISYDPSGPLGMRQIIAARDNAGCPATLDTVLMEVIQLNVQITNNAGTLSAPVYAAAGYQWYKDNVLISGANTDQYSPTTNGNYTVKVSLVNCSKTSAPFSINTFPPPIPIPSISNIAKAFCSSTELQKGKLLNPPPAPATITITIDGGAPVAFNSSDSSFSFSINATGDHIVSVKYASTIENKSKDTSYTVKQTPPAGAAPLQSGNKLSIPVTGNTYQWYRNSNLVAGATQRDYNITQPGQYAYTYSVNDCLSPFSAALNASVTSITDPATNQPVFISPNPANDYLYVSGLGRQFRYSLQVLDLKGIKVKEIIITGQNRSSLYIGNLARGLYVVWIKNITAKTSLGFEKIEIL